MHIIYYLGGWGGDRVIERETESGDIVNQLMLCREYFFFHGFDGIEKNVKLKRKRQTPERERERSRFYIFLKL